MTTNPQASTQQRALGWLTLSALLAIAWLVHPFGTGLLLGALMAFTLDPLYSWLSRRTGRAFLSSVLTVTLTAVGFLACAVGFLTTFAFQAIAMVNAAQKDIAEGGAIPGWLDTVTGWLARVGISQKSVYQYLGDAVGMIASRWAGYAATLASGTFLILLSLFFAFMTMHVVLRHWNGAVAVLAKLAPLRPEHTREFLEEFRRVGNMTLRGTVLTGVAQGALAMIGYWITGVPQPLFFGIATAVASVVPAVGTLLIWVPAAIYLFATGHAGAATVELLWGTLIVVGFTDYVIRPRLVGDEAMPALLTFLSLFGGLEVLGIAGLIVGPVLMSVAVAVVRTYAKDARRSTPER